MPVSTLSAPPAAAGCAEALVVTGEPDASLATGDAARVAGASRMSLIFVEILPNALGPVVVNATLMVGQAMLLEAGLSYLGLGDPTRASLGQMLQEAQQIMRSAWWTTAFPGLLIFLCVLSLNLVGDGLTDILNPRSRER